MWAGRPGGGASLSDALSGTGTSQGRPGLESLGGFLTWQQAGAGSWQYQLGVPCCSPCGVVTFQEDVTWDAARLLGTGAETVPWTCVPLVTAPKFKWELFTEEVKSTSASQCGSWCTMLCSFLLHIKVTHMHTLCVLTHTAHTYSHAQFTHTHTVHTYSHPHTVHIYTHSSHTYTHIYSSYIWKLPNTWQKGFIKFSVRSSYVHMCLEFWRSHCVFNANPFL